VPPSAGPAAASWMDEVSARLAARPLRPVEVPEGKRRAGVLIPLYVRDGSLWVLLTRRTETVEHHRGQISFPGGAAEDGDESLLATAVRETEEELGIAGRDVRVLGALSPLATVTDFYVEPFVGAIPYPYPLKPADAEIAELVDVPVPSLLAPEALEERVLPGRTEPTLFYHHGRHVIWGATARMLKQLLDLLR
jgi:8-oxo-dGTP pyrophosphatase MutT (NUDIX family)